MNARHVMAGALGVLLGSGVQAQQVGTTPDQSPFRDMEKRQDVTLFFGLSTGGHDRAGAAPRGGGVFGARYDVRMGNTPLAFTAMVSRQGATRDVLQPGLPVAQRVGASVSQPLYFLDGGFTLLLTGGKSWNNFVPSATFGAGMAFDPRGVSDSSKFSFGSRISPSFGLGLRYAPVNARWTVRGDIISHFYGVKYPQTFRDSSVAGVPRIVPINVNSSWTRNTAFTLGITRGFGRR